MVAIGYHAARKVLLEESPIEVPTLHWPPCNQRPTLSALPSPLKSPTLTSTQVTPGFHVVHSENENALPVLMPTHHWPVCSTRAATSVLPSPLKSPVTTSTQVTAVEIDANMASLNALTPLD